MDPLDEQMLEEIHASIEEYEASPGNRLAEIRATGSYPDTVVEVVYETPEGLHTRSYDVWKQFRTEDPEEIGFWVWRDVAKRF
jgi:hypothetical protein